MKMVTIGPVPEPASFADVAFTAEQYKAAVKVGKMEVPMVTAQANVRKSKGLYRIMPLPSEVAEMPKLPDPADMPTEAIFAELTMFGKAPQKQMARSKAVEFLRELRKKSAAMIVDDEE